MTANQLKEIGQYLVDIQVQHDTHRLFNQDYNYQLIDNFDTSDQIEKANKAYQKALKGYNGAKKKYLDFKKNADEIQKRMDLILFQKVKSKKSI